MLSNDVILACPQCGKRFLKKVKSNIQILGYPEDKEAFMSGSLFEFQCPSPSCNNIFYKEYPLYYFDEINLFNMWLIPPDSVESQEYENLRKVAERVSARPVKEMFSPEMPNGDRYFISRFYSDWKSMKEDILSLEEEQNSKK